MKAILGRYAGLLILKRQHLIIKKSLCIAAKIVSISITNENMHIYIHGAYILTPLCIHDSAWRN